MLSSKAAWQIGLRLGGVICLALAALGLTSAWNAYQLEQAMRRVVALEERAILTGDMDSLRELYADEDVEWLATQQRRAEFGQVAPLPMQSLWPALDTGVVKSVETLTPNTVRVEVIRRFFAPDGGQAFFALHQFYRFADGKWQRVPLPESDRREVRQWTGQHVEMSYFVLDEAVMTDLGPYLDGILTQACAAWACPDDLRFDLRFLLEDTASTRSFDFFSPSPGGPMIFALIFSQPESFWGSPTLPLASPHLAGYPADTESQALWRRLLALEILARLPGRLVPDTALRRYNPFRYALAARLSVALQLDSPQIASLRNTKPAFTPEELWTLNYRSTERPLGPFYTQAAQLEALALLNLLLQDQPPETESRLFRGLRTATDPAAWLAEGLNIPPDEARARLRAAIETTGNPPASSPIPNPHTFTLGCRGGLAAFAPDQTPFTYSLAGRFYDARPVEWSPDGKRLLIYLSGQPAVVEADTGALLRLPDIADYYDDIQWVSNTVIAYTVWPRDLFRSTFDPSQFSLNFFDVTDPQRASPPIAGVRGYALSPDRSTAAVVQVKDIPFFDSRQSRVALMPALGGPLTLVGEGLNPAWSPDGRTLLYVQFNGDTASLHVVNLATESRREIFNSGDWDVRSQRFNPWVTWSPTGEHITLVAAGDFGNHTWVWAMRPDGSGAQLLLEQDSPAYADPASFSADGEYLAVHVWNPNWVRTTLIYDPANGKRVLMLPNVGGWPAWSPTGHQLALSSYGGLYVIAEPGDPQSSPKKLADEPCYRVLWDQT